MNFKTKISKIENQDVTIRGEKLSSSLGKLGMTIYESDFSETEEGKLWYECNKLDFERASLLACNAAHNFLKSTQQRGGFVTRKSKREKPRFSSTNL